VDQLALDLHLDLTSARGVRTGIEDSLREAIRAGQLSRGTLLPSTRALAQDLGVSRGTVVAAYTQLAAEGWIGTRAGFGAVVVADPSPPRHKTSSASAASTRHDLRAGFPAPSSFPRVEWLGCLRRALLSAPAQVLNNMDPEGLPQLRFELARYLGRARGLRVTPDNIVVTNGFTHSLHLLARVLDHPRIAIEEPSNFMHRAILREAGHELVLLPVDTEGAVTDQLGDVGAAVVTPNCQFPLGVTLSARRRSRLIDWARETDAIIVENDFDGEFRYDSHPLTPLQALQPESVVYAGTTSKSLTPGLRLGWLALPDHLVELVRRVRTHTDLSNGVFDQLAFTEFLRTGSYDRHIRKQRLRYRQRRDAILSILPEGLEVSSGNAGLNLVLYLPDREAEGRALAAAAARGLAVEGLSRYYEGEARAGLIVGYGAPAEHTFASALEALADTLRST
jgi:GntR family transcriptional regulator/MocR family aminotransferase